MNRVTSKDCIKRKIFHRYEVKRKVLKSVVYNQNLDLPTRQRAQYLLDLLPRNSCISRVRNRCIITGRGRGIYSNYKLSRIQLREKVLKGELAGIKKSSW